MQAIESWGLYSRVSSGFFPAPKRPLQTLGPMILDRLPMVMTRFDRENRSEIQIISIVLRGGEGRRYKNSFKSPKEASDLRVVGRLLCLFRWLILLMPSLPFREYCLSFTLTQVLLLHLQLTICNREFEKRRHICIISAKVKQVKRVMMRTENVTRCEEKNFENKCQVHVGESRLQRMHVN